MLQIETVLAEDAITLNHAGRMLSPLRPIYSAGDELADPVAFLNDPARDILFRVSATTSGPDAKPPYRLRVTLQEQTVLCSGLARPDPEQPHCLMAELSVSSQPPAVPSRVAGPLAFTLLDASGAEVGREVIEMEIFFLTASLPLNQAPRGVPLEALREITAAADREFATPADLEEFAATPVATIVNTVFGQNPPRYDVWQGRPHFTEGAGDWNNLTFHYGRYRAARNDPNAICNCYDAAAYLQYLLKLAGYQTKYCFMQPFGYLRKTDLIGRGLCNNPFYKETDPPVVAEGSPRRTAFGNHAFCAIVNGATTTIGDACAGPHRGGETMAQYVETATDNSTPNPPRVRRGTVGDVGLYTGVTRTTGIVPFDIHLEARLMEESENPFARNVEEFKQVVGYRGPPDAAALALRSAVRWPDPLTYPELRGWQVILDDIASGYPESSRRWVLRNGDQTVQIDIFVASDSSATAHRRFLGLGSAHQADGIVFERGPANLGEYSARFLGDGHSSYIWLEGNTSFEVASTNAQVDLVAIAQWLQGHAGGAVALWAAAPPPPTIQSVRVPTDPTKVGQVATVEIDCDPGARIDFTVSDDSLMLVEDDGKTLRFLVRRPGEPEIAIVAVDPSTLLSAHATAKIRTAP